jgi:glyoxylase-like metal-dependent hydrolase (beta-lactamase superfamily II)
MMRDSIRELSKLPFRWICPAHGRPLPRHDAWEEMMVHLA